MWNVVDDNLTYSLFALETDKIKTPITANFDRDNLLFYVGIKQYPKMKNPFDQEFSIDLKEILQFLSDKEISTGFIFKNVGNLKEILDEISKLSETVVYMEENGLLLLCDQDFWDQKYKYMIEDLSEEF